MHSTVKSIDREIDKLTEGISKVLTSYDVGNGYYAEMGDIFNKDNKWKSVAIKLGYQNYLDYWQKSRNPIKTVLLFAKVNNHAFVVVLRSFIFCINFIADAKRST